VSDDFLNDPALLQDFLVESEELLQGMDQDMVALETAPKDADLLNRIFRAMHTIKGTSGFLGLDPIVKLAHRAEDVLNGLRRGECPLTRAMMDALLRARDQLGRMLADLRAGKFGSYALDEVLAELEQVQKPQETRPLGEILVANKVVPVEIVASALEEQASQAEPLKLGQILVEKGAASAADVGNGLLQQKSPSSTASDPQTMRVDVRKLDDLINLVGELVLERNRLVRLSRDLSASNTDCAGFEALSLSTARLSFVTEELQIASLKTRMVPIEHVFRKFPRLVRDVAHTLGKQVELVVEGQETEIDKTMVELIGDPLVHLVRNSIDHGLELPDIRERAGKSREGTIRLEAAQQGDQIVVRVSDDGAGIDQQRVLAKALEKGLVSPERARSLTKREILDFIFLPGFSTAQKVGDLSGRGVGMDVVRSNLRKLNGAVELDSEIGRGTEVRLRLPLTLAILPVLLVEVHQEVYALPLRAVVETVRISANEVHQVEASEVLQLRGRTIPLLRLGEMLGTAGQDEGCGQKAVILGIGNQRIALLVDKFLGQESTVVKPLSAYLHGSAHLAGATISGDGRVRLVLDPAGLLATAEHSTSSKDAAIAAAIPDPQKKPPSELQQESGSAKGAGA
jgi:two-component system, chemotaxis family, sensor kinase CheA